METFLTRAFAIPLCLLIVASATHAQEPTPTPPPPIIYTGRLIGYFRSPSLQPSGMRGCPSKAQALAGATRDETPSNAAAVVLGTNLPANAILLEPAIISRRNSRPAHLAQCPYKALPVLLPTDYPRLRKSSIRGIRKALTGSFTRRLTSITLCINGC